MSRKWMTAVATALVLMTGSAAPASAGEPENPAPVVDSASPSDLPQPPSSLTEGAEPQTPAEEPAATAAESDTAAEPDPTSPAEAGADPEPGLEPGLEPAQDQSLFVDLPAEHWAYPAVERLVGAGVIHGDPQGRFRPDAPISRGEFVKMLLAARRLDPAGKCDGLFADAQCWTWYAPYVELAYRLAILDPKTDMLDGQPDYFDPEGAVTRQEIASALIRATGKRWAAETLPWQEASRILGQYRDAADVSAAHRKSMALAIAEGLMRGFDDGTLRPWHPATRAEAAVLISRVLLDPAGLQTTVQDGHALVFVAMREMKATMYSAGEPGVGTRTATGVTVRKGAAAVDPSVIPLGTLLFVEGYGYAVALDTGGAVKGNVIDLYGDQPHLFGVQTRRVWVLP